MGFDNCKHCPVPDNPRFYDIESEDYFTCSDCACSGCLHLHDCEGQCGEREDGENNGWVYRKENRMKIKTIRNRLDNAADFDEEVNAALTNGWRLVKREYINPQAQGSGKYTNIMLYAELVKDEPTREQVIQQNQTITAPAANGRTVTSDGL